MASEGTSTGLSPDTHDVTAGDAFARDVQAALRHLYDPVFLRRSALLGLFGAERSADPLGALRHVLVDAINQLKPGPATPSHADAWRIYRILYERYVEQFEQEDVASHLSLGVRQIRRHEGRAVRVLADHLWRRYHVQDDWRALQQLPPAPPAAAPAVNGAPPGREQEIEWLRTAYPIESVSMDELIQPALKVVAPLAHALGAGIVCQACSALPRPAVQLTTMHQALSNVITAALHAAPGGTVEVIAESAGGQVVIRIRALRGGQALAGLTDDDRDNIVIARRLVRFSGAQLDVDTTGNREHPFLAQLTLPAAEERPVLVIEDNTDTLNLMQRHLQGTRYRFYGTTDPGQALALAGDIGPAIVVLDIMLPIVDGWELLGRLREHPQTHDVPILACSILAQEQLALSLGAAAFLRKPINRATLLAALDALSAPPATRSE